MALLHAATLSPSKSELIAGWPVDGFEAVATDGSAADGHWAVLRNDRFELRMARRPTTGARPPIGLTATWAGQGAPVVLAEVHTVDGAEGG